jgi:hypothetical protein
MDKAKSVFLTQVLLINLELDSKDITYSDFLFTFDKVFDVYINDWEAFN